MSSASSVHTLLTAINCGPAKTRLDYSTYRKYFSVTQVPALSTINSPSIVDGVEVEPTPLFVVVDRDTAVEFLKQKHGFYTRTEMIEVLEDVASDFNRTIQRES